MDSDFVEVKCHICGEPRNALRDGKEIILRCSCDWQRGFLERLKRTVSPLFWKNGVPIKLTDYKPPIFKDGGNCRFKEFIRVQQSIVMLKLWNFAFKNFEVEDKCIYILQKNIENRKNLFIRGPNGSGRGLLVSNIKLLAAVKDISSTPTPDEWANFKSEIWESEAIGKQGEIPKVQVAERYQNVDLLTIQNMAGRSSSENKNWKFKGAGGIDTLLSKRECFNGSLVCTSSDFIGEIGEFFGEKIFEILCSSNTMLLLMFSPSEADLMLCSLQRQFENNKEKVSSFETRKEKKLENRLSDRELAAEVENVLAFEAAFPKIPFTGSGANSFTSKIDDFPENYSPSIINSYSKFKKSKESNDQLFKSKLESILIQTVSKIPDLGSKMTDKEKLETGKMLSVACSNESRIVSIESKSKELLEKMTK